MNDRVDLGDFAAALRDELELELREDPPVRDLADVLARARAIDEDAIPHGLRTVPAIDAVVEEDRIDVGLAPFAAALRNEVEASVGERQLAPIPARPRRIGRVTIALGVAAAVLLAVVGLAQLVPQILERDDADRPLVEAGAHQNADASQTYTSPEPPSRERRPRPRVEPVPVPPPEPPPLPEAPVAKPAPKRHAPTLDELDADANARWAAGDLAGAEAALRKIIARSGRSARAELAYGDLFAIARQRGGSAAQAKMWREYLQRFPRGRYADDARGGLCRLAPEAERATCWRDYLTAHARGAHAREARRWLQGESG